MAESLPRVSSAQRQSLRAPTLTQEHRAAIAGPSSVMPVAVPLGTLDVQLPPSTVTYPTYVTTTTTGHDTLDVTEEERFRWRR